MSEFNIEDLDAVIASAESSLVQMLALQLKGQIRKSELLAAENVTLDKMSAEHRADGVDMLYASKAGQWPSEYLAEIDEFSSLLREGVDK